jgi:hypothetical protein
VRIYSFYLSGLKKSNTLGKRIILAKRAAPMTNMVRRPK